MGGVGPGLKSAILIGFALLTAACGLETFPYLSAPQPGSSTGVTFIFLKTTENSEPEFRGFELYYRLYRSGQFPDSDITDQGSLAARGFHRLCSSSDVENSISKPLVTIPLADRDESIYITVNFTNLPDPVIMTDPDLSETLNFELRRNVVDETGISPYHFKDFAKEHFEIDDSDINSDQELFDEIQTGSPPVQLALYVLSFGKKELIQDIYSVAVYLGSINITTFP